LIVDETALSPHGSCARYGAERAASRRKRAVNHGIIACFAVDQIEPRILLTHVTRIFQKSLFTETMRAGRAGDRAGLFAAATQAAPAYFFREQKGMRGATQSERKLKSGRALAQARKAKSTDDIPPECKPSVAETEGVLFQHCCLQ
jgi:hypothetical protein